MGMGMGMSLGIRQKETTYGNNHFRKNKREIGKLGTN